MDAASTPLDVACQLGIVGPGLDPALLSRALPPLAEAGFRRVVLPRIAPDAPVDLSRIAALLAESGLAPIGMAGQTPDADVGSADPAVRARGLEMLRHAVEVTSRLGGDQLNGVPYGAYGKADSAPGQRAFEHAARAVGQVANEAHERGIRMTFEVLNRYETPMVNTAPQAVAFVEASGSPHLGIHLDTFHMSIEEEGIALAVRTALPHLAYVELGQSGRGALSTGVLDMESTVAIILDEGYDGRWGVEAFTRALLPGVVADRLAIWREPYADGLRVAADAQRVIRNGWARSSVGRRAAREQRAAEARTRQPSTEPVR
ncbi:sugar phosphate isomerase/epimerase family protein [Microbacterium sp. E-13]|uniref:sugar phosphate isomerase/epimerase family protein n=1 Tax=Microbacterium sp. E-13 TaxID=3404048 RepID=UPI003CFBBB85